MSYQCSSHPDCLHRSSNIFRWSCLQSAPLFTHLARLPNLVALRLTTRYPSWGAYALWDQHGAIMPNVQRVEMMYLSRPRLQMADSHVPLQSILSMFPALSSLSCTATQCSRWLSNLKCTPACGMPSSVVPS